MKSRRILMGIFSVLALAALGATPVESGFAFREFACDFGPSADWLATIFNLRHLVSFAVLAAIAFASLKGYPVWVPVLGLLLITVGVELEQAVFASGHCRVRDMLPNGMAIGLGFVAATAINRLHRKATRSARTDA